MSLYKFEDIRLVHLEISSRCNAACPQCLRNFYGYPYNNGYVERDLTLQDVKKIFKPEFVKQLWKVAINGNFGDIVMNPESLDIIEYFKQHGDHCLDIYISTNGGAKNRQFWQRLAELNCLVSFCIDGLEDTHSIYRRNTLYSTVIRNAETFIGAGGRAIWNMIEFDHNQHQIEQCKKLSEDMGFERFDLIHQGRTRGPVYDTQGKLVYIMGPGTADEYNFKTHLGTRTTQVITIKDVTQDIKPIRCQVQQRQEIYVASTGDVYPCCYLGAHPQAYGQGTDMYPANQQVKAIMQENNALVYDLEHCIKWFDRVEESWSKSDFESGRLLHCNKNCGY